MRRTLPCLLLTAAAVSLAGCASSPAASSAPVLAPHHHHHHVRTAALHKAAVRRPTPRQLLAAAIRNTLAAHTATITMKLAIDGVAANGKDPNPLEVVGGEVDFDHGAAQLHYYVGPNSDQPRASAASLVVLNNTVYIGPEEAFIGLAPAVNTHVSACSTVDSAVSVLDDLAGPVTAVGKQTLAGYGPQQFTHYRVPINLGQALLDCNSGDPLGQKLLGYTATEDVWVDGNDRIVRYNVHVDTGTVPFPGLPSQVTGFDVSTTLGSFGTSVTVLQPGSNGSVTVYRAQG